MTKICTICKHEENEHSIGYISQKPLCSLCAELRSNYHPIDPYHKFKQDNLKYLEDKYTENNK